MSWIGRAITLDKVIRYNFVPARKEEQFCTCTAQKLHRYSINAREKDHLYRIKSDPVQCNCEGKGTLLYRIKSDPVQCQHGLNVDELKKALEFF